KYETAARDHLEQLLYPQLVARSQRAWREHDTDEAVSLLEAGKPPPKRPDLRGWEWHYLQRLYRPPKTFTYRPDADDARFGPAHEFRSADGTELRSYVLACAPDNAVVALALLDNRVTLWNSVFGSVAA